MKALESLAMAPPDNPPQKHPEFGASLIVLSVFYFGLRTYLFQKRVTTRTWRRYLAVITPSILLIACALVLIFVEMESTPAEALLIGGLFAPVALALIDLVASDSNTSAKKRIPRS